MPRRTIPAMADLLRKSELRRRADMWSQILANGGPDHVSASVLKSLRVFRDMRGIWVDKEETAPTSEDGVGVTVSLLATSAAHIFRRSRSRPVQGPGYSRTWMGCLEHRGDKERQEDAPARLPGGELSHSTGQGVYRSVRRVEIAEWDESEAHSVLAPLTTRPHFTYEPSSQR